MEGILTHLPWPSLKELFDGFVKVIPEFSGYLAIFIGAYIILGSMFRNRSPIRPLGLLGALYLVMICMLEVAY